MKKFLWAVLYGAALTAFTAYALLDTFVLPDKLQANAGGSNYSMFEDVEKKPIVEETAAYTQQTDKTEYTAAEPIEAITFAESNADPETSYTSDNVSITLNKYNQNNTEIYVAEVWVTSAEHLKTAFAEDTYGRNVTAKTSSIADSNNAVLAINGDYYGAREKGIVIRNGAVYRESADGGDVLCLYADGTMRIFGSNDVKSAKELVNGGVWQAWSFGPALVENGSVSVSENDEVGKAMASNPRTAIGMIDSCHYVFVVSDGRTRESEGLSLYELGQFMLSLGVQTAYNLDGGGSSTMYFKGEVVNNPTTNGSIKERKVSDIIYIGYE